MGDDWFKLAVERHYERERQQGPLSSAWSTGNRKHAALQDMLEVREIVRNVVRMNGVPKSCRVELAGLQDQGAGAAGFEDAPKSFEKPFILLDKKIYESCPLESVVDVYCGLGFHESGHIKHTREGYRRIAAGISTARWRWENLWEDERIEELVRQESPGATPYLQITKRLLLEKGEIGRGLASWDALPDLDKISVMLFAFVRCPYLLTGPMRAWAAVNGECVFQTLCSLFPSAPKDEKDVHDFARRLEELWTRLRKLYPGPSETSGNVSPDRVITGRLQHQRIADAEDRALGGVLASDRPSVPKAIDRLLEEASLLESAGAKEEAEQLLEEALGVEKCGDLMAARAGRRFGLPDIDRFLGRLAKVTCPLNEKETKALKELETEPRNEEGPWKWGGERRTLG